MTSESIGSVRSWYTSLSPGKRALVVSVGTLDGALRVWALVDVARRPADQIRGRKVAWVVGLSTVSSGGILPAAYLLRGRRPTS